MIYIYIHSIHPHPSHGVNQKGHAPVTRYDQVFARRATHGLSPLDLARAELATHPAALKWRAAAP